MESRKTFDEYIKSFGIDPENPVTPAEKLTLPIAFSVWNAQQRIIDELENRIHDFKMAFNNL